MDIITLKKMLNDKALNMTNSEIESILNEELENPEGEMDAALVELCLKVLNENVSTCTDECKPDKHKKIKFRQILICAALIAVIIAVAIPVCGKFISIDANKSKVTYDGSKFSVSMVKNMPSTENDIVKSLVENGIDKVVLPKAMFADGYSVSEFGVKSDSKIDFTIDADNVNFAILIFETEKTYNDLRNDALLNENTENVKEINVNGIYVLVMGNDESSYIIYTVGNKEHYIALDCGFEKAIKFAQTINTY